VPGFGEEIDYSPRLLDPFRQRYWGAKRRAVLTLGVGKTEGVFRTDGHREQLRRTPSDGGREGPCGKPMLNCVTSGRAADSPLAPNRENRRAKRTPFDARGLRGGGGLSASSGSRSSVPRRISHDPAG